METTTKPDGTKVETTTAKDGSTSKTTTNPNGSSVTENKAADGSTGMVNTVLARLAGVDTTPAAGQNWYDKGICVSELRYITVEAALAGWATITLNCDSPVTQQKVTRRYK